MFPPPPPGCPASGVPKPWLRPTPSTVLTPSLLPAPSHSSSFPGGFLGAIGRNFWPRVRGGAPAGGRQHTHARDRSEFQLPRACWEHAKQGQGGVGSPSSRPEQGEPGEGPGTQAADGASGPGRGPGGCRHTTSQSLMGRLRPPASHSEFLTLPHQRCWRTGSWGQRAGQVTL